MIEIYYFYDINLEDDNTFDFKDLSKKALVLVKYKKFLTNLF